MKKLGHFINFDPTKYDQETAAELHPEKNSKGVPDLVAPGEWAGCEIEREIAGFSRRNKNTKP